MKETLKRWFWWPRVLFGILSFAVLLGIVFIMDLPNLASVVWCGVIFIFGMVWTKVSDAMDEFDPMEKKN